MTDTDHIKILREFLEGGCEYQPEGFTSALRSLLARASAGEGGELARIGELIRTQDNRITDSPIFIVQQKCVRVADPDYDNDGIVWVNDDNQEAGEAEHARLEAAYPKKGEPEGWRRLAIRHEWEFVTACFTEQGCKDYLARDGHNLKEPRIYAAGSYRNEEWRTVRKFLMGLTAAPQPAQAGASGGGDERVRDALEYLASIPGTEPYLRPIREALATPASPATGQVAAGCAHVWVPGQAGMMYCDQCGRQKPAATPQPAAAPQAHPAQGERKCRFCGCKETPERAADPYTTDGTVEVCPQCNEGESYVTECRHLAEYVAGVLTCTRCGFKWTTPPAHGDGEGGAWTYPNRNALIREVCEGLRGYRFDVDPVCVMAIINSIPAQVFSRMAPPVLTTRPTPEAQARDAARYRWLRQFDIGIDHQGYDDYRWYAYAKPEPRNGRLGLDAVIDAALALPAQGEGNNG